MERESIEDSTSDETFEDSELIRKVNNTHLSLPETSEDDRDDLSERIYNSRFDFLLCNAKEACNGRGIGARILYGLSFVLMFPINYALSFVVTRYSEKRRVVVEV